MQLKEVYYHFGDASVPPPDHRSYTLQVKKDAIDVTIDSYGEILAQHHFDASSRVLEVLSKALQQSNIDYTEEQAQDEGCTGGTTATIGYTTKQGRVFRASNYYCGGKIIGNLAGDVTGFVQQLKQLVPNLQALIRDSL
jgi:hypothetical protein